jgi:hypothetical protein
MQGDLQVIMDMLPFLIPVLIIELGLMVFALVDIVRREYVTGGSKVLFSLLGPIVYFIFGRKEKKDDDTGNKN